jgi:hypothetical protein
MELNSRKYKFKLYYKIHTQIIKNINLKKKIKCREDLEERERERERELMETQAIYN